MSDSHRVTEERSGTLNPDGVEEGWGRRGSDTWNVSQRSIWIRSGRWVRRGRASFQTDNTSCANCGKVVREREGYIDQIFWLSIPTFSDFKQCSFTSLMKCELVKMVGDSSFLLPEASAGAIQLGLEDLLLRGLTHVTDKQGLATD